jgi:hypothetical protein
VTGNSLCAEFVSTVADWTMARQFDITGAFIADSHRRTGCFNTAYLAEGIAAALAVSHERGERRREAVSSRAQGAGGSPPKRHAGDLTRVSEYPSPGRWPAVL